MSGGKGKGGYWIAIVVALLAGNVAAVTVLIASARAGDSHQVVDDYYRRAVAWDDVMAQQRANGALGWAVTMVIGRDGDGAMTVEVAIRDRAGAPIEGATVAASLFQRAHAGEVAALALASDGEGAGRYRGVVPRSRAGVHEVALTIERATATGPERYVDALVREAP